MLFKRGDEFVNFAAWQAEIILLLEMELHNSDSRQSNHTW